MALAKHEEAVARIVTAREIITQNLPDAERTPGLNQTGWLEHLKGRNSRVLSNATKFPGASKVGLQKRCTIAKELVSSLNRTAFGYRPGTLRKWLRLTRKHRAMADALYVQHH